MYLAHALQKCYFEQLRAAREILRGNRDSGGPALGLHDWIGEEILLMLEGRKNDEGKIRFDLIPGDSLFMVGQVYTLGATKYNDRNWEQGLSYGRVFAALLRHAWKWFGGETYDQEDGQHHLASVVWCALSLLHYDLNPQKYGQFDNRPKDHIPIWLGQKNLPPSQLKLDLKF
jgi:hypothetical protein